MEEKENQIKPFWKSKTLIASAVAFVVAILTAIGVLDTETGLKAEAAILPVILALLRISDYQSVGL